MRKKVFKPTFFVLCHVVLFLIIGIGNLHSQQSINSDAINSLLIKDGFENVSSVVNDTSIIVAFENRRYRDNGRAIAEILLKLDENFQQSKPVDFNLILLYQKVPMLLVRVNSQDYDDLKNQLISIEEFDAQMLVTTNCISEFNLLKNKKGENPSMLKPDIVVIPQIKTQFGNFDNPVQSNINLIPELNIQFTKGLSFQGQLIIPLQNDFYFDEEGKEVRPGNITLNQLVRLEDDFFINVTGGFFDKNRAGVNLEIRKNIAEGKFCIGSNIAYTTGYSYTGYQNDYLDYEKYLTALLELEYRYIPFDLTGSLQVGNFLYNNFGARFDVIRQFGEVNIGFFALYASGDFNGGFKLAIPLPPRKYTKLKYVRVRPSRRFDWEYKARGFYRSGTLYKTGHRLHELFLDFNPDQIKNQIIRKLLGN